MKAWLGLAVVALVVAACSGGSMTVDADAPVDALTFCTNEQTDECARELAAGRIDSTQYNACRAGIATSCSHYAFPSGCFVDTAHAQACYDALLDTARLGTPSPSIPECQLGRLCGP